MGSLGLAFFALLLVTASAYAQSEERRTRTRWESVGMGGLGSWPPSCRWKCGRCAPCVAVHVPVQPGRARQPMEYYPEAWRCKCGGKLYMP